ncbi:hypothetical protein ONA91_38520 [Micromonospora sp. DR5-3]|uniref:hypothetical protein n=1 Tax=unclassified Micromonospora TaxID=2617518 RepID=UPI0011D50BA3|nr:MULTISPECIES: hypothetical protein [unclassified Micromonospora]MCW3820342.1 hypothetical protein [Micromonospora sp. DR5-3]TYC19411.1 hypothetical protein FXF52_36735 [Micromonospora sp. MP36]
MTAVGDRTQYESGWYGCCMTVLGWFLDSVGIESTRREELLEHAVAASTVGWSRRERSGSR